MFPARWIANLAVIEIKPLRGQVYRGEGEAFQRDMKKLSPAARSDTGVRF
jgi:hypothetical protein